MTNDEQKAVELGQNRTKLRTRLLQAKMVLHKQQRALFSRNRFDFVNKRLVSDDGLCALQWKVRAFPSSPIGPDNQQTNVGIVTFLCTGRFNPFVIEGES